jgi:hypothetical protein
MSGGRPRTHEKWFIYAWPKHQDLIQLFGIRKQYYEGEKRRKGNEAVTELYVRSISASHVPCCSRGKQRFEQVRLDCIQHSQCAKMNEVEKGQVGKVSPATFRQEGSVCTHNVCEPATSRSASALRSWAGSFSMNRSLAALPRINSKENKLCLRSKQTAASLPKSTCSL